MRRYFMILMLMFLGLSLNGCGFKDLDKRFFVVAMGVDKADDPEKKYKVILKLAIPSPTEKFGANEFILVTQDANEITDAVRLMKSKVDKELDFGQMKMILFSEEVAKGGVHQVLDWFVRRRDIQRIAWVGVAKPNADAILTMKPKVERLPGNALFLAFGQAGTESAFITSEYLFDFRARLKERGLDPVLPVVEAETQKDKGVFNINTVALFDKQKMKTILPPEDTKTLNAIAFGIAKVDIKVGKGNETFMVAAETIKSSFKLNTQQNKPRIVLNVQIEGIIEESKTQLFQAKLTEYEHLTGEYVKKKVLSLLKKLQKENVDPIGFGLRYRGTHFNNENEWEEWISIYPTIDFKVNVRTKLRGTGLIE